MLSFLLLLSVVNYRGMFISPAPNDVEQYHCRESSAQALNQSGLSNPSSKGLTGL
jgi:hypothetical protein